VVIADSPVVFSGEVGRHRRSPHAACSLDACDLKIVSKLSDLEDRMPPPRHPPASPAGATSDDWAAAPWGIAGEAPHAHRVGPVSLVGAGPGEPGAITLRALECLAAADAVVYDYLVNPSLLRWANRPGVQLISLGGHAGSGRVMAQSEVCDLVVALARQGRAVVRLKSGDPMIFARAAEEIEALNRAGIPYEIVPGITSALAVGSYAGIPLTHRQHASAVALVTGHPAAETAQAADDVSESPPAAAALDWAALARFPGTIVVYMGTTQVEYWVGQLLASGKDPGTPVAILRRCGFYDQSVQRTTLGQLIAVATQPRRIRPPVVFVIGTAVQAEQYSEWFVQRPLHGQAILLTRPADQAGVAFRQLELLGAQVLHWPAIQILPVADPSHLDLAIDRLNDFDWLIFNSVNGVTHFLDRLWNRGQDVRRLGHCRLAAIGAKTAQALEARSLRCDLIPEKFDADALADRLIAEAHIRHGLIIRASRGRDDLAARLQTLGVSVTQVVAYQNVDQQAADPQIKLAMEAGKIDWVTVTSSAIADNLVRCFGAALTQVRLASLSPITSGRLRDYGLQVAAEAEVYTFAGLLQAIVRRVQADHNPKAP
jgi:uroporphyrinogen III methyltransferase / synthase